MAVTRVGSHTINNDSGNASQHSYSHTTTADTSLLLLYIHIEGAENLASDPTFGATTFSLIHAQSDTGNNGDTRTLIYGILSPGARTNTITISFVGTVNPSASIALNFAGTVTTSITDATNVISSVQNTGATSTTVFSSGGSAGNALFVSATFQGADGNPASESGGFSELWDQTTDTTAAADFSHIGAELFSGLPAGTTVTWSASDENGGVLLELVAAAAPSTALQDVIQGPGVIPFER